ncbi:hypothetical protein WR25_15171 [Diploscapter pachys]|uniref:G-protein coupled receptors family 1 profile domain-containing protein n=1 Tax=Diploscapter pachys TaxID=2018661 RepID=A0A2A2KNZ1_9BILA|nr:hypothetical protein WR25_15171 [Diploscapter pachys]
MGYGIVVSSLVITGVLTCKEMRTLTSYWFIVSLACCVIEICALWWILYALQLVYAELQPSYNANYIGVYIYGSIWYAYLAHLSCMAVNRFVAVVFPLHFDRLFSRSRTPKIIVCCYVIGFLACIPDLFDCCRALMDKDYYSLYYENVGNWFFYVDVSISMSVTLIMVTCYSCVTYKIWQNVREIVAYNREATTRTFSTRPQQQKQFSKKEYRIFVQFLLISLMCLISTLALYTWDGGTFDAKWFSLTLQTSVFVDITSSQTFCIMFNPTMRRKLIDLFCFKPIQKLIGTTSTSGSGIL